VTPHAYNVMREAEEIEAHEAGRAPLAKVRHPAAKGRRQA